jgi:hypothetical protein
VVIEIESFELLTCGCCLPVDLPLHIISQMYEGVRPRCRGPVKTCAQSGDQIDFYKLRQLLIDEGIGTNFRLLAWFNDMWQKKTVKLDLELVFSARYGWACSDF